MNNNDIEVVYKLEPNFRKLGKLYGKDMKVIQKYLNNLSNEEIIKAGSDGELYVDSLDVVLKYNSNEDVEYDNDYEFIVDKVVCDESKYVYDKDKDGVVILDLELTDELLNEGLVNEFVRVVQSSRKDMNFDVEDHFILHMNVDSVELKNLIDLAWPYISKECLLTDINYVDKLNQLGEPINCNLTFKEQELNLSFVFQHSPYRKEYVGYDENKVLPYNTIKPTIVQTLDLFERDGVADFSDYKSNEYYIDFINGNICQTVKCDNEYMGRGRLIKLSNSNEGVNSEVIINNNVRHSYFHICDEDTKLTQQQLVDNGLQAIGEYLYI